MFKQLRLKIVFLICTLVFTACVSSSGERKNKISDEQIEPTSSGGSGGNNQGGPGESGGGTIDTGGEVLESGEAEIRHLVDPFDGTYKTKLTIPKNFTGKLYLSGLNIASLSSKIVHVRFTFGRGLEPITLEASIGRAPGIIPQTDIEVLILNVIGKPFEKIRLLYDLYDYTDYRDNSGVEFGSNVDAGETIKLTSDTRSSNLYCRGLRLEHDPTFVPTLNQPLCNYSGAKCLYTYSKVVDTGLYNQSGNAINPMEPQVDLTKTGYANDTQENNLKKCLPDNNSRDNLRDVLGLTDSNFNGSGYGVDLTFPDSTIYEYRGPYRAVNPGEWEVTSNALWSEVNSSTIPTGLFSFSYGNTTGDLFQDNVGYQSFLFPRVGIINLSKSIDHFSSTTPLSVRTKTSLITGGDTNYVDGCNIRTMEYNSYTNEGISSCNITAKIELIHINQNTYEETLLANSSNLKLQLIRSSNKDFMGQEVLYTSMKKCSTSATCGNSECCFNERCWDKTLVSRCLEDVDSVGNGGVGDKCSSDYECSSFCCNQSTGRCNVHINNDQEQVLCGKPSGQTCVSKEWCKLEYINECKLYKTGTTSTGQQDCKVRCYQKPTFGLCKNGICIPPPVPAPVATPDPTDPNRCNEAIDPPTEFSGI